MTPRRQVPCHSLRSTDPFVWFAARAGDTGEARALLFDASAVVLGLKLAARLRASLLLPLTLLSLTGCASLRLNGCRRLEACGVHSAYACGSELVCADDDGKTIYSEQLSGAGRSCRVCRGI